MAEQYRNILLKERGHSLAYTPNNRGGNSGHFPIRKSRTDHGKKVKELFTDAWEAAENDILNSTARSKSVAQGIYLQVRGESGYDLITKSLEDIRQGVRLVNVKAGQGKNNDVIAATVFIPNHKRDFFIKKINKYIESENEAKVISTIGDINKAVAMSLWTSDPALLPSVDHIWCEVWLRYEESKDDPQQILAEFQKLCASEEIQMKAQSIYFPERLVVGIFANNELLSKLMTSCSNLAEYRFMKSAGSFFTELSTAEQQEWIAELLDRVDASNRSNTSICILDTGVNNGHPLLSDFVSDDDLHTYNYAWGLHDNAGHGTEMAGIAVYNDLEECLSTTDAVEINHFIESSKIINRQGAENPEELYGEITQQAVYSAEIQNPGINRTICMAVTAPSDTIENQGSPSTWSGAIDAMISGVGEEERDKKRLMFVSAGNTTIEEIRDAGDYKTAIRNHSVEDPGQSWNCITVGAYTEKDELSDARLIGAYEPVVQKGSISPFSSSSLYWEENKWPIKPELLCEGGNLVRENANPNYYSTCDDLSLITTAHDFVQRPLTTIAMTSSATAQAAWISANIQHEYPHLHPETIRALMIHSATWADEMKQFAGLHSRSGKADYRRLLRTCGYGVPNIDRAIWSASNSVNMIIEDELQPFIKKASGIVLSEMHIHTIPWPKNILLDMDATPVKMRLTLSYYIEPGPGRIGWRDKYLYPSCGLRFDVNNSYEDEAAFTKRINKAMRDEEDKNTKFVNKPERWVIGSQARNVGSIHSDIWEGTASELAESNKVIIYPITGWWKQRTNLRRYDEKIRYSLVISIETPETEVDLYQAIQVEIANKVSIKTEVTAI